MRSQPPSLAPHDTPYRRRRPPYQTGHSVRHTHSNIQSQSHGTESRYYFAIPVALRGKRRAFPVGTSLKKKKFPFGFFFIAPLDEARHTHTRISPIFVDFDRFAQRLWRTRFSARKCKQISRLKIGVNGYSVVVVCVCVYCACVRIRLCGGRRRTDDDLSVADRVTTFRERAAALVARTR